MTVAELVRKTAGPEVVAERDGTCKGPCGDPDGKAIRRGEHYIAKVDGRGWMHALCARAYCAEINEEVDLVEAERAERDERFRQVCRELRELDVPEATIDAIEQFAASGRRAA